ncbi:protocadherin gamma-B5-like isoform X27 [Spea bombifrons]|uniref:protocadherin gamma-B5-like isoform X27 n=1 Tax=Spea bombifrons TaxID=233779 RepID=UPI00234BE4A9|nr:protocadherin gamma-B5-like isoform X27 [Spea bombifrons]
MIHYSNTWKMMIWQVVFFSFLTLCVIVSGQIQYSILEELKQGSVVGNVAKDLDLYNEELTMRKLQISSQSKNNYFSINSDNGNLCVINRIDRESICGTKEVCFLKLEILAENPMYVFHVTIEIQDINDNPPSFSKTVFNIAISENASPGARFALGKALDPDLGFNSLQSYTITPNEHFKLREKMNIDGNEYPELILETPLDREKQGSYDLILTAFDGGKPVRSGTALIKIVVQDVNDNYPVFSQDVYKIVLNENVPVGFLVLILNATDDDETSNAQITYSFSHVGKMTMDTFSIDPDSGSIRTQGPLDFEVEQNYELTVEAEDGGGLVTHCTVLIQIIDANDNSPEIMIKSLATPISEDSMPGTLIALINVKDQDSGKNGEVTCNLMPKVPFQLVSTSDNYYKLVTTRPMDREKVSDYNITIIAEDAGNPPMSTKKTILLSLSDVNDNPPFFDNSEIIAYILEHNHAGASICTVQASDLDINENAQITYSILDANIENIPVVSYISINSVTGVLYAQRSLDYEQLRELQFQVTAKDHGSPPLSTNVTVKICVIDQNDNAPKILYPSPDIDGNALFEFVPSSAEKGYLVTKVIAVDADSGHNAWLSYYLLDVPDSSNFIIGQHTGEIRIARHFQDTDSLRHKVVVLVKDNGVPSLSATVTLNLVVAEHFQQFLPEIVKQPKDSSSSSTVTFYLVTAIAVISILFILTVIFTLIAKCRKATTPTSFGTLNGAWYPHLSLKCPSEFSEGSLPLPYSYDVCVTLDSRQNEIAYLKPVQNVPMDNLIDTDDLTSGNFSKINSVPSTSLTQQAQPNTEWRFSQAQRPGPSGAQPTEEAGVWPNNQFETERLQAMILASANEAAEGTSGLGGGTGTMGLSARYGPQFTLQHVPDYRQNVYIPGSTLTPTNAAGKRDGKSGGNKKKSGKKEKK